MLMFLDFRAETQSWGIHVAYLKNIINILFVFTWKGDHEKQFKNFARIDHLK